MHIESVKGEARAATGKAANSRLRKRGMVPAVIYGHGKDNEMIALSRHDLELVIQHTAHVIKVDIGDKKDQYLVKDVQYDHLQKTPIHVDLMRVKTDDRVHVKIGIEFKGEPHGLHEGGELIQVLTELEVECPLLNIPDLIKVKIDHLGVGEALHVREVELPEGTVARHDPDDVVATVRPKRGRSDIADLEEGAEGEGESASEPEVVGRTAKDEGSEGEG